MKVLGKFFGSAARRRPEGGQQKLSTSLRSTFPGHAAGLTSLLAACLASSCVTASREGVPDQGQALKASAADQVVLQASQPEPVLASQDRRFWLDERQKKEVLPRLKGAIATGEAASAIDLAKARLATSPGDPGTLMFLSSALALTRNYQLASYYADLLIKAAPSVASYQSFAMNIKGLSSMMVTKAKLADFRRAEAYFQKALELDGSQIAAALNLGHLQLELGNAQGASQTFAEASERCQQCLPSVMGLGIAQSRAGQFAQSLASFQFVLKQKPTYAPALYHLALVYKNGYNDRKRAESYLDTLLRQSETKNVALKDRAQVVLRMIKGEASPEERTRLVDDKKDDAELLMTGAEVEDDK